MWYKFPKLKVTDQVPLGCLYFRLIIKTFNKKLVITTHQIRCWTYKSSCKIYYLPKKTYQIKSNLTYLSNHIFIKYSWHRWNYVCHYDLFLLKYFQYLPRILYKYLYIYVSAAVNFTKHSDVSPKEDIKLCMGEMRNISSPNPSHINGIPFPGREYNNFITKCIWNSNINQAFEELQAIFFTASNLC